MTLRDVATQLYNLSVDGKINGEKYTRHQFEATLRRWMQNHGSLKLNNRLVIEITLRDGTWLMTVDKFADNPDGYDYWIPDTREQEADLWRRLTE